MIDIDAQVEIISVASSQTSAPVPSPSEAHTLSPSESQQMTLIADSQADQNQGGSQKPPSNVESDTPLSGLWQQFLKIAPTGFQHKSLADFSLNPVVGCFHACRFCYVPEVSTIKQSSKLRPLGVNDPDADWGRYGFIRIFDEKEFRRSLMTAENTPISDLPGDGHRAVMFSTTTDPFQVFKHSDPATAKKLTGQNLENVRRCLELIRDESTLRVRLLTRSPLAKQFFTLFKTFGNRVLFGMSLPTLNDQLAKVYEPHAPSVKQRLETLKAAKAAGLNIFVAIAPTYPECDEADLRATLKAIAELDPVTIFHEPINIRAENVKRIQAHAEAMGVTLDTAVFATEESWQQYALDQLRLVERIAKELGVFDKLHLWPDPDLKKAKFVRAQQDQTAYVSWVESWWTRVSEWPGVNDGKPGKLAPTSAPAKDKTKPATSPKPSSPAKKSSGLTMRSPDEILAMTFDPSDLYLENGVFAKGQTLSILGPGGLGKSRGLIQLATCTILGRSFVGMEVHAKDLRWLILQGENSNRRLQADLVSLKKWTGSGDWKQVSNNLHFHTLETANDSHLSLGDPNVVAELTDIVAQMQPDVIAIDPLAAFAAGSLNNDAGMLTTCKAIDKLASAGGKLASVVVLHHTLAGRAGVAKATGYDRGSYGRGSKTLNFWTRGQINIAPASSESNERLVMSCGKNSNGEEFAPFGVRLNSDTMIYEADADFDIDEWREQTSGQTKQKKLSTSDLRDIVTEKPMSRKQLLQAIIDRTECKKSTAYALIDKAQGTTIKLNAERLFVGA